MTSVQTMTPEQQAALEFKIEREIRRKARQRVYSRVGFMWHLVVFVLVNIAIAAINLNFTPDYYWFVWPLCGWGFGLLMHALATFVVGGTTEKMIQQEIENEKRRRGLIS